MGALLVLLLSGIRGRAARNVPLWSAVGARVSAGVAVVLACTLGVARADGLPEGHDWQNLGGSSPGSGVVYVPVPAGFGWLWWCQSHVAYPGVETCHEWGGTSGASMSVEALDDPWHDGDGANLPGSMTWFWVPLFVEPPDGPASAASGALASEASAQRLIELAELGSAVALALLAFFGYSVGARDA